MWAPSLLWPFQMLQRSACRAVEGNVCGPCHGKFMLPDAQSHSNHTLHLSLKNSIVCGCPAFAGQLRRCTCIIVHECSTGLQEQLLLILHIQAIVPQLIMINSWQKLICAVYRTHLYGDIYSSPGLEMRQKQLLMCAFLGQANMPDELFGHAVAVSSTPTSKHLKFSVMSHTNDVSYITTLPCTSPEQSLCLFPLSPLVRAWNCLLCS